MTDQDFIIRFEMIMWMGDNKWLNENPEENDFSIEYFYNFFSKKFEGITRIELEKRLCELYEADLVELRLYWSGRVDVIRGLTPKGIHFYKTFENNRL